MRKNDKGGEDTLLAKMYGSNPSIQGQIRRFKRLGGLGRGRNREGGGRNESSLGKRNLAVGLESMLGARIHGSEVGAELGTKICGSNLGAVDLDSEFGAMDPGAEHGFKNHSQVSFAEAALISSSSLSGSSSP